MRVFAVMPAFQEAGRVRQSIEAVNPYVEQVVVVDDGSTDATGEEARGTGAVVLSHVINRGQGAALRTGTRAALKLGADIIIHMDADGQHDPSFIPELIRSLMEQGADVLFGSRFLGIRAEGMPLIKKILLPLGRVFNSYALGIPYRMTDPQSGLRVMNRRAAEAIKFTQNGFAHCSEILRLVTRSDLRWKEVPVKIRYTEGAMNKSKRPDPFGIVWSLFWGAFRK